MNINDIINQGYIALQEDPVTPLFWTKGEVQQYIFEGLRDILKKTEINITDRAIPLYAQVLEYDENNDPVFESFNGYYSPPISEIQKITAVYWKDKVNPNSSTPPAVHQLQIKTLEEMDLIDSQWRTAKGDSPVYAILYSGDFNEFNMQVNPFRNRLKIKLYPTPENGIDPDLQTALYAIQGDDNTVDNYSPSATGYGGLAGSDTSSVVWGIDEDGDGLADNGIVPGSTTTGIITQLQSGAYDISDYGYYPFIRYIPEVDKRLFYTQVDGVLVYNELNGMLPYDIQLAMREYMCYRCFDKEGEAQDEKKAAKYYQRYEDIVIDYQSENLVMDTQRVTCDSNFSFGMETNRQPGSGVGHSYNTLRL